MPHTDSISSGITPSQSIVHRNIERILHVPLKRITVILIESRNRVRETVAGVMVSAGKAVVISKGKRAVDRQILCACHIQPVYPRLRIWGKPFDIVQRTVLAAMGLPVPLLCVTHISIIEGNIGRTDDHHAALMAAVLGVMPVLLIICDSISIEDAPSGNGNILRIPDTDRRFHRLHALLDPVLQKCAFFHIDIHMLALAVPDLQTGISIFTCREIQCIIRRTFFINLIQRCLKRQGSIIFKHFSLIRETDLALGIFYQLTCLICHITAGRTCLFCFLRFTVRMVLQILLHKCLKVQYIRSVRIRLAGLCRIVDNCQIRLSVLLLRTAVDHDQCIPQIALCRHRKCHCMLILTDLNVLLRIIPDRINIHRLNLLLDRHLECRRRVIGRKSCNIKMITIRIILDDRNLCSICRQSIFFRRYIARSLRIYMYALGRSLHRYRKHACHPGHAHCRT